MQGSSGQGQGQAAAGERRIAILPTQPRAGAEEIAPGVFWLEVGSGITRANVYFVRAASSWALIDAGPAGCAPAIQQVAESLFGVETPPAAILLTHCHADHSGSAHALARLWSCPLSVHPDELPFVQVDLATIRRYANPLDRWLILPLLRLMPRQRVESMFARGSLRAVTRAFDPDAPLPGLPGWQCIPTPGHTPGHATFFRSSDRVLIAADALATVDLNSAWGFLRWGLRRYAQRVAGPPWYSTWNGSLARQSVAVLARLEPQVLACGHGRPMTGPSTPAALRTFADQLAAEPANRPRGRRRAFR